MTDIRDLVRPWVKGQPITEDGIYSGLDIEAYHNDPNLCDGPSVSKTVLGKIEERSAKHAFAIWKGNPNRKVKAEAPHFALGRAIHHLAGGEAQFAKHFAVRPAKWDSWRTGDAKEWRAQQVRANMGVLEPKDIDTIQGVADSLNDHPTIQAGILKGLVEHTVAWKDPETGIWVLVRPDVIPVDSRIVTDLKTIPDASRQKCEKAIAEYLYHMQMAMIDEGLRYVADWAAEEHVLAFVEKVDPWLINLKPLEDWAVDYGRRQFRRSLRKFAECVASGVWTGYDDDEVSVGLPTWYAKRLSYESENGLLPKLEGVTSAKGYTPPEKPGQDPTPPDDDDGEAI